MSKNNIPEVVKLILENWHDTKLEYIEEVIENRKINNDLNWDIQELNDVRVYWFSVNWTNGFHD